MRPFQVLAPNKSSGDRIKDLKAKIIFEDAKLSFKKTTNRCNNFNDTIRYTKKGALKSTNNNELKQILSRGQALCEDGICVSHSCETQILSRGQALCEDGICVSHSCDINSEIVDDTGSVVKKRGLLNCPQGLMATAVKIDTNANLFSHYVQGLLPTTTSGTVPIIDCHDIVADITDSFVNSIKNVSIDSDTGKLYEDAGDNIAEIFIFDPSGVYMDSCAAGGDNVISGNLKQEHLWNSTTILGSQDINGTYQTCQGGSGINLSWGNNTKQNYLISYDPNNKIVFNTDPNILTKNCNV